MSKEVKVRLLVRSDTAANWEANDPILKKNEMGYDITAQKFKIGDGTTKWSSLPYVTAEMSFDFGDEG